MNRADASSAAPLVYVWLALLVLLGLTAASALLPLGSFNVILNLGISAAKTVLVAVFFMHLRASGGLIRLVAVVGLLWLGLLIALALADYLTRIPLSAPW